MKNRAVKPWRLKIETTYEPNISILVPMHNEEKTILFKLENLCKVNYPKEKTQILVVNDGSTDNTLSNVYAFINSHQELGIKVLNSTEQIGKANSLNYALKNATGDVIIVSDADCFWPSDILAKALPYLSDSKIGAVVGREALLNPQQSWVTKGELSYNSFVQTIRIGESKTYSTIFFQGGFAAYKKTFLDKFDNENDDSGTALRIVQKQGRTLLIPEVFFYTAFPIKWRNKITTKIRRANQQQRIWIKCVKLSFQGKIVLPKKIVIPEIFLYIFNPIVFVALSAITVLLIIEHPIYLLVFLLALLPIFLIPKSRALLIEMVQNNGILVSSIMSFFFNKKFRIWKTVDDSRLLLSEDILKEKELI
jgi:biofilm PGA synthesis N-glycosyltransferase PgaC